MKTSKLSILVSLLLTVSTSYACGPYYYSAADNRLYRLLPPLWNATTTVSPDFATQNILLWSRQTGCNDTAAIRKAVYEGTLAQWESLRDHGSTRSDWFASNAFVQHLTKRNDIAAEELLCLSKRYESIRNAQRSPWYYDSRVGTDEKHEMQKLYTTVRSREPYDDKYANRWHFLAIKCAWASSERDSAIGLWHRYSPRMKGSIFNDEAEDYVARCLEELGRKEEAHAIYRKHQSWTDAIPSGTPLPSRLRIMLQIKPHAKEYAPILQEYLTKLDLDHATTNGWGCEREDYYNTDSMLIVARMAIENPRVKQKAMWRYAAACILDYRGRQAEALEMLKGAADGDGNTFLRMSVRTLTFHLRARTEPMTDAFEQYAIGELQWLDSEMLREWGKLPQDVRSGISNALNWSCVTNLNKLYSYSAMRRIVLEDSVGLAWRMAGAGRGVRALQMANMADNHLIMVSDNSLVKKVRETDKRVYKIWYYDRDNTYHDGWIASLKDTVTIDGHNYGYWHIEENTHDYSNGMFVLADRLSAGTLEQYRQRQLHPKNDVDRWFNVRSYTNGDYWQDIVGTHYLRERNYSAAVAHLKHVSPTYQQQMNITCNIDPFSIDCTGRSHDSTQYKLHFAQRMDSLQRAMLHGSDADKRGLAMLEYTIGLENSFGMCWWITSYQKGWTGPDLVDIAETEYAVRATAVVRQLREKTLRTLQSDDARARYHLRLGHYVTVRKRYAYTPTGQRLALACDGRRQYRDCRRTVPFGPVRDTEPYRAAYFFNIHNPQES